MKNLSKKEKVFCEKYVEYGLNGTQAALAAGFGNGNPASAAVQASRKLKQDNIQDYINLLLDNVAKSAELNASAILAGIKNIAYNPAAPHSTQLQAFKLLGEYLNIFDNKPQVIVNNNISTGDLSNEEIERELARLEELER